MGCQSYGAAIVLMHLVQLWVYLSHSSISVRIEVHIRHTSFVLGVMVAKYFILDLNTLNLIFFL